MKIIHLILAVLVTALSGVSFLAFVSNERLSAQEAENETLNAALERDAKTIKYLNIKIRDQTAAFTQHTKKIKHLTQTVSEQKEKIHALSKSDPDWSDTVLPDGVIDILQ